MSEKKNQIVISVIVCTYNRANLLQECLDSLAKQTLNENLYEVIVVDNNSVDQTSDIIKKIKAKYANFRSVEESNQGLSYARNRGYKQASGEFIAFIDDDAIADSQWLLKILEAFQTVKPKPSAVGGKIEPLFMTKKPGWFLDEFETHSFGEGKFFLQPPSAQYGFNGSNMAVPKVLLEKYGGFSPDLGMVAGEIGVGEETGLFFNIYSDLPNFWYDSEIQVKHMIFEQNMKLGYWIWRSFLAGRALIVIEKRRFSFVRSGKTGGLILLRVVMLLFRVRWWRQYWQRDFLKYTQAIANLAGQLIGELKTLARI